MQKIINIDIPPDFIEDLDYQKKIILRNLKLHQNDKIEFKILKKSLDARKKIIYKLRLKVYINETLIDENKNTEFIIADSKKAVGIVGFGPAGMFAALRLLELGIKPIIFERGKKVQDRRRDLKRIQQDRIIDENSNYCFGEGGAGTFSDGKLYTRSTKRGDVSKIISLLIQHGAPKEIAYDAHPHIGSNLLPKVVQNIRETILNYGGEIHFESKVTDFLISSQKIVGVVVNNKKEFNCDSVILATGHSARDIYYLLNDKNIKIEGKSFAVGVRIEHPQQLIDKIQYKSDVRHKNLPASSYALNCQVDNRGVYSFCMCPGGIVIPASTSPGEIVLNGMSVSKRDSEFANSGLVVSVDKRDFKKFKSSGVFAGLEYQKQIERSVFSAGGNNLTAPAQRITDFVSKKLSATLPKSSYIPGVKSAPLHEILPNKICRRLSKSLILFNQRMKGYFTNEGQLLAAETRTSSPIKIPRDKETLSHIEIKNLYPCGEGAGYAGGIVSAAIDGVNCANATSKSRF